MTSLRIASLPTVVLLALAAPASAHIQLNCPRARTTLQKDGDCGAPAGTTGAERGTSAMTFRPGRTLTVQWDETVDHDGHFRISFNADGDVFEYPTTGDEEFAATLVDDIANRVGGGAYEQTVTLPDVECDDCTLQLIQVMKAAPPYAESNFYYQCADLVLSADAAEDDSCGADDGGGDDDGDGGGEAGNSGCAAGGSSGLGAAAGLFLVVLRRRRRR